jgi:hypothetical protein
MKHHLAVLALALPLMLAGCSTTTATQPATLAPGYQNSADQQMGEILAGAHSFYTAIQTQSAAGSLTLTAAQKAAFNDFGVSLNAADTVYLAYHASPTAANLSAAQTAVNVVTAKQAALPTPGVTQ